MVNFMAGLLLTGCSWCLSQSDDCPLRSPPLATHDWDRVILDRISNFRVHPAVRGAPQPEYKDGAWPGEDGRAARADHCRLRGSGAPPGATGARSAGAHIGEGARPASVIWKMDWPVLYSALSSPRRRAGHNEGRLVYSDT
jgi:hypothetical protein